MVYTLLLFLLISFEDISVEPMKNKTTKETLTAIKNVFHKSRLQPETFRSDAGKEFIGKDVNTRRKLHILIFVSLNLLKLKTQNQ